MIQETIYGIIPSKSNCYKIITIGNHASLAKTKSLKDYEKSFYMQCKSRDKMVSTFFEIRIDVYYPANRADLDNSLKAALDCLQVCKVIKNDNLCTAIVARKFIDKDKPRVEITLTPVQSIL